MYELHYLKLLKNAGAELFLSEPYGFELLFVLDRCEQENADNGIDDTFDLIMYNKPRRAAFSNFSQLLESKKHLSKSQSSIKASKTVLRMSKDVAAAFQLFRSF